MVNSNKGKNVIQSRKTMRKQRRKEKKARKHEYYTNRKKPGKYVLNPERNNSNKPDDKNTKTEKTDIKSKGKATSDLQLDKLIQRERKDELKLKRQMQRHRTKQLEHANLEEDRNIRKLEKQLKLNKRKSKSMPKSFASDGLDYLLEVCDSENIADVINSEQQLVEAADGFEEDIELITGSSVTQKHESSEDEEDSEEELDEEDVQESGDDLEMSDESSSEEEEIPKRKRKNDREGENDNKKLKVEETSVKDDHIEGESEGDDLGDDERDDGSWQDIYGRRRAKDGSLIEEKNKKYVPPAIRAKLESNQTEDKNRVEKLNRLKKQLKGLINRLAESNMHSISTQMETLYMNNSRNDMNDTLTNLILESLVSHVLTPERLLLEHVMLITILHANVGSEVGAHFLQTCVRRFDELFYLNDRSENKKLDNIVLTIAHLYNFKLFHSQLLYNIMDRLTQKFDEKDIECILHILKSVGFTLRKDDPLALKNFILNIQKQSAGITDDSKKDNSRVKFMLDILLAIKNNNMTKIPNYDPSYAEHLKKLLKSFIRKGYYVTQLNISLEDLLKADERGKWWIVGSAWTGNAPENTQAKERQFSSDGYSEKLLELARKQRMNTDTRRSVFCIIMSAEDYLDAFEKLLRLGLKGQQEQEIIHVILHCCLQEKTFNRYYALLAQKFCEQDRKYQMAIKCSVWDKLKSLDSFSGNQIANLAKLLIHLFIEKGLPISTLKIVQFSELDKTSLRFIRQILLGILLHDDTEECLGVFEKVALSDKLKMFRESLKLFIHYFLLKNLKEGSVPENKKQLLETRASMIEKLLNRYQKRI